MRHLGTGRQQEVDDSVEQADEHQQDAYHHGNEGCCLTVFGHVEQGIDVAGDQLPPGRDQENDRADGGDRLGEGVDNAGEESVFQHGQCDAAEGVAGVSAQNGGGLLNGVVDLQQSRGAGLDGHRHIAECKHDHQNDAGAGEGQRLGVEAQNIADTQHGTGNGEHQNGGNFNEALAVIIPLGGDVGDDHAQQAADDGGDQAQRHGVLQAVPAVLKGLAVLIQRQGEVYAPCADKGGEDHSAVEQDDDDGNDQAESKQRPLDMGLVDELSGLRGLAGNGDEALFIDPVFIEKIRDDRRQKQKQRQDGAFTHIVTAGDNVVDFNGERGVIAADGSRIGEILQRLDKHQQRAGNDAGERQGECYRPEGFPAASAHVAGGVLHGCVDGGQNTGERQVGDGEEAHDLHNDQALHAIHAAAGNAQQVLGDQPLLAEQEDDGQGQHKRRGEDGKGCHGLEKAFSGDIYAGDCVGEYIADERGDHGHDQAQRHGAAKYLAVPGRLQNGDQIGQRERAGLVCKAVDQRFGQRIDDEQQQKRK